MTSRGLLLVALLGCGGGDKPAEQPASAPPAKPADAAPMAIADAEPPLDLDDASPREEAQNKIHAWINAYWERTLGKVKITAGIDEDDLVIVVWEGKCDRAFLERTRKLLVAEKLDPAPHFTKFICEGPEGTRLDFK